MGVSVLVMTSEAILLRDVVAWIRRSLRDGVKAVVVDAVLRKHVPDFTAAERAALFDAAVAGPLPVEAG